MGDEEIIAGQVIIATGSRPRHLPEVPVDNLRVAGNVGALEIDSVPKKLLIIGAGVIGLEIDSVWRRLGARVSLFWRFCRISCRVRTAMLPKKLPDCLRRQGLDIQLGVTAG